jgi:hypothetical protein
MVNRKSIRWTADEESKVFTATVEVKL